MAPVLIVTTTLAAFSNSLTGPCVFDAIPVLVNPAGASGLAGSTTAGRPLLALSFAINRAISGVGVESYHVTNLLIHILAAVTLFGLVRRTLAASGVLRPCLYSLIIALTWAVHPLQTESVTYVVQRAESLMGLLFLVTLYTFTRYLREGGSRWAILSVTACVLGAGAKEVMVAAPRVCQCYDQAFVSGSFSSAFRSHWRVYCGLFGSWIVLAVILAMNQGGRGDTAGFHAGVTWSHYAARQSPAILHYLRLALAPYPLVFYYGRDVSLSPQWAAVSGFTVLLGLGATLVAIVRWPAQGFLAAAFFLILAPSSSVVPVATEVMAEHRMYLPLAAVIAAVVVSLARFGPLRQPAAAWIVCLAVNFALALATWERNEVYQSEFQLWTDTVLHDPDNADAHYTLAGLMAQRGDYTSAAAQDQAAIRCRPRYAQAYGNLGLSLEHLGRAGEAATAYETAVSLRPDLVEVQNNLANLLLSSGDVQGAVAHYRVALGWQPGRALTHLNLGLALTQGGDLPKAIQQLESAADLDPALPEAAFSLGNAYAAAGRNADAARAYERALLLRPNWQDAQNNLAVVRARGNF